MCHIIRLKDTGVTRGNYHCGILSKDQTIFFILHCNNNTKLILMLMLLSHCDLYKMLLV